jgi:serine/threonine-protein kinase
VLVSFDGAVKVSDFGIAKWAFQRTRTQEGTLKGKFAYMSPEQCRAKPVDRRSDIFALGAILYELTTGAAPFSGASELDILNQIATGRATPPVWPEAMGTYPPALSEIVMRALAPEPDDRFATMQALQVALESFARTAGLALSTVELASYVQDLFAEELAAWRAAQREGKSLGDHLAASPAAAVSVDPADRTATDAFETGRIKAQRRARGARYAALAVFFALCTVMGGLVTKHFIGGGGTAPSRDTATADFEKNPRSVAPGAERNPATVPTAEKTVPSTTVPAVATSTTALSKPGKGKARMKPAVIRQARDGSGGQSPGGRPTVDSRLGAWDPDSPVPP